MNNDYISLLNNIKKEEGISDLFLSHVHELLNRNYKQSQIAKALSVSNTTVSKWVNRQYTPQEINEPLPAHVPEPYTLSKFEEQNLKDLAKKATKVSRNTPENAPSRRAAETLEQQLLHYISLNTPITQLAKAANVSRRSIYQRMEKYR